MRSMVVTALGWLLLGAKGVQHRVLKVAGD